MNVGSCRPQMWGFVWGYTKTEAGGTKNLAAQAIECFFNRQGY